MHTVIFKRQEARCRFTTEKCGIQNKKQGYCPPHSIWKLNPYPAGSPPIKELQFSSHHSWTGRFKCHSNRPQAQEQAARIHSAARVQNGNLHRILLHKRSLSSRCFYSPSAMFLGKHSHSCGMWITTGCIFLYFRDFRRDLSYGTLPSWCGQRQVLKTGGTPCHLQSVSSPQWL